MTTKYGMGYYDDKDKKKPKKASGIMVTVKQTASGKKFAIQGAVQAMVMLKRGVVYAFDQSDKSNLSHEMRFSTTKDGTHEGGSRYTSGISSSGSKAGADMVIMVELAEDAPSELYYYCANHPGMGGKIQVSDLESTKARRYKPGSPADDRDQRTPAPPRDRRRGSDSNKPGSAGRGSSGASIKVPASAESSLKTKVQEHNEKHGDKAGKRITLGMLKKVWRRGAGAFSGSHRPGMTRAQWAMARVNHFLHLVRTGSPKDKKYIQDNDVLPKGHPRSTRKSVMIKLGGKQFELSVPRNIEE